MDTPQSKPWPALDGHLDSFRSAYPQIMDGSQNVGTTNTIQGTAAAEIKQDHCNHSSRKDGVLHIRLRRQPFRSHAH